MPTFTWFKHGDLIINSFREIMIFNESRNPITFIMNIFDLSKEDVNVKLEMVLSRLSWTSYYQYLKLSLLNGSKLHRPYNAFNYF